MQYIFDPHGMVASVSKPAADRLERWAMLLRVFGYGIQHVPGDDNNWADMLSRWANPHVELRQAEVEKCKAMTLRVRPDRILTGPPHRAHLTRREDDELVPVQEAWPSMREIRGAQSRSRPSVAGCRQLIRNERGVWRTEAGIDAGCIYVPSGHHNLRLRLMVVAHAGAAGHRGVNVTVQLLERQFFWPTLEADVQTFVRQCILCVKTRGGRMVPRPLGRQLEGQRPDEVIHMDYISLSKMQRADGTEAEGGEDKGLLVIKDAFSLLVTLTPAAEFTAEQTEEAVLHWCALLGVPQIMVSDGGSHFDNTLVKAMVKRLRAEHHITTAYSPWANGAIERTNRTIIALFRPLLAETQMSYDNWLPLVPLVQATINQLPSDTRLGGLTPTQVHMSYETPRPLDTVSGRFVREGGQVVMLSAETVRQRYLEAGEALRASWLAVRSERERRHLANERQRNSTAQSVDFAIGDFVLAYAAVPRNKLRVKWLGPYHVTDTLNERVFEVKDISSKKRYVMHAQRLKLYCDASLNCTEDLRNQAAYDDQNYVTSFLNFRETDEGGLQLLTCWMGFERNRSTWEDVRAMHHDVPAMVMAYLRTIEPECDLVDPLLREWDPKYEGTPTVNPRRRRGKHKQASVTARALGQCSSR